jgi:uncharacterized protein with HEPN domain
MRLVDRSGGKTFAEYSGNELLRLAVERAFEILAEALNNVLRMQPELADRITNAPRIISFRNRINHEYWGTVTQTVWSVLHEHVQPLKVEVQAILAGLPPPDDGRDSPPESA